MTESQAFEAGLLFGIIDTVFLWALIVAIMTSNLWLGTLSGTAFGVLISITVFVWLGVCSDD